MKIKNKILKDLVEEILEIAIEDEAVDWIKDGDHKNSMKSPHLLNPLDKSVSAGYMVPFISISSHAFMWRFFTNIYYNEDEFHRKIIRCGSFSKIKKLARKCARYHGKREAAKKQKKEKKELKAFKEKIGMIKKELRPEHIRDWKKNLEKNKS